MRTLHLAVTTVFALVQPVAGQSLNVDFGEPIDRPPETYAAA